MITFICICYYAFSLFFGIGYVMNSDEHNPWIIIASILVLFILAPILFPFNLGTFISNNSD